MQKLSADDTRQRVEWNSKIQQHIFLFIFWSGFWVHANCMLSVNSQVNIYIFEAILKWISRFLQPFIVSWMTQIWLTAAKFSCPCNTLWTSSSFARSDTCDWQRATPKSHLQNKHLVCSIGCPWTPWLLAFPFYIPTKPFIRFHIKYKTVLFPVLYIVFIFQIFIINVNISKYI